MANPMTVKVGQIWADRDPRAVGLTVRAGHLMSGIAVCGVLANSQNLMHDGAKRRDSRGQRTRISRDHFRPMGSGYILLCTH